MLLRLLPEADTATATRKLSPHQTRKVIGDRQMHERLGLVGDLGVLEDDVCIAVRASRVRAPLCMSSASRSSMPTM